MNTSIGVPWDGLPRLVRNYVAPLDAALNNKAPSGVTHAEMVVEANGWIRDAHSRFAPPLHPIDVLGLCSYALFAKHYVSKWREEEGYLPGDESLRADHWCARLVVQANPNYAMYAGLYTLESLDAAPNVPGIISRNYAAWKRTVMRPAMMQPPTTPSMHALGSMMNALVSLAWRTDPTKNRHRLQDAWIDNGGGNEKDVGNRERPPSEVLIGVLDLLFENGFTDYHRIQAGRLTIDSQLVREKLGVLLPRGTQASPRMTQVPEPELLVEDPPECDFAILTTLRDLRDKIDARRHRLLAEAIETALLHPLDPESQAAARGVAGVASQIDQYTKALQAALVYELFKSTQSQRTVALDYGVSEKQLRVARREAVNLLPRLAA